MKICIVCSAGGHLLEALEATRLLRQRHAAYLVTYRLPHLPRTIEGMPTHFIADPHLSLAKYLLNVIQSAVLVLRHRPDVIISTGSGMAIATCLFGKCLGARLIYVESGARVTRPSRTGQFLYRWADLFIIQWPSLQAFYPKAVQGGPLI